MTAAWRVAFAVFVAGAFGLYMSFDLSSSAAAWISGAVTVVGLGALATLNVVGES